MAVSRDRQRLHRLLDELRVEELLPDAWAAYRPLLREALEFFLAEMPPPRRLELAAAQAVLPAGASPELRLFAILRSSPTLHKLGQVVARDPRLPGELGRALRRLESLPPSLDAGEIDRLLQREAPALAGRKPRPLAEASVAVVATVAARDTPDGEAVLKLLKPGIEDRLAQDLRVWDALAAHLERRSPTLGLPDPGWVELFGRVRNLLLSEIDFAQEQRNLGDAAACYRDEPHVEIPSVLPASTPRVTAMTRIAGVPISETPAASRRRAARSAVAALVVHPLFSTRQPVLFHGDPHAGNLFWTPDERVGLLDWALAGRLDQASLVHTMRVLLAAVRLDAEGILSALDALALERLDEGRMREVVHQALARLRGGSVPGLAWLTQLLDQTALRASARYPEELLLFRKSLLTLNGVVSDLVPGYLVGLDVVAAGARQLSRELPDRLLSGPFSRHFPTHLSNLDLLGVLWSGPALARNFWSQTLGDWWRAGQAPRTQRT